MPRHFTTTEDQRIIELAPICTSIQIGRLLGRHFKSVEGRARKYLGIYVTRCPARILEWQRKGKDKKPHPANTWANAAHFDVQRGYQRKAKRPPRGDVRPAA